MDVTAQSASELHFKAIVYHILKFGSYDFAIQGMLSRDSLDKMTGVALCMTLPDFRAPATQRLGQFHPQLSVPLHVGHTWVEVKREMFARG